jgi:hypothetical protein
MNVTEPTTKFWDFFIADNAETPHCGVMLAEEVFITAPLALEKTIGQLHTILETQYCRISVKLAAFLKNYFQGEFDRSDNSVIFAKSESWPTDDCGFWNSKSGWGGISELSRFTDSERKKIHLPASEKNDAVWVNFLTLKNESYADRLHVAAIEAFANRDVPSIGSSLPNRVTADVLVDDLRRALRECLGFVDAWYSHLDDRGGNERAIKAVEEVLTNARSVYERSRNHIVQSGNDEDDCIDFSKTSIAQVKQTITQAKALISENVEILPGATSESIRSVSMLDIVGDYDNPNHVPEWQWVERNASLSHVDNGKDGVWQFTLNLDLHFDDIPNSLKPIIGLAMKDGMHYLHFHHGI